MINKKNSRLRRAKKTRSRQSGKIVLRIVRSSRHIQAQVFNEDASRVLASATTLGKAGLASGAYSGNCTAAAEIGKLIAQRAKAAGITKVAFDRSGYRYHGRVKALAEAAREEGLDF